MSHHMSVRTAIINAVGDTYSEMPIREVMRGSDAILSALRSAGFAVVPVEPTEGMLFRLWKDAKDEHDVFIGVGVLRTIYAALIKAAQLNESETKEGSRE